MLCACGSIPVLCLLILSGCFCGSPGPVQFPSAYGVKERDAFYKSVSFDGWGGSSGHDVSSRDRFLFSPALRRCALVLLARRCAICRVQSRSPLASPVALCVAFVLRVSPPSLQCGFRVSFCCLVSGPDDRVRCAAGLQRLLGGALPAVRLKLSSLSTDVCCVRVLSTQLHLGCP